MRYSSCMISKKECSFEKNVYAMRTEKNERERENVCVCIRARALEREVELKDYSIIYIL